MDPRDLSEVDQRSMIKKYRTPTEIQKKPNFLLQREMKKFKFN